MIRSLFLLLAMSCAAAAEPIAPAQIKISDGDTIRVGDKRYRLVGFDTPEVHSRWRKVSEAEREKGFAARKRLKELVQSGPLDLTEVRCSCPERIIGTRNAITGGSVGC
jgi:endonuclease YncB( thermonuclease family)